MTGLLGAYSETKVEEDNATCGWTTSRHGLVG